jgi:ABC-type multidrug transport system fused ATPase/permease subunit
MNIKKKISFLVSKKNHSTLLLVLILITISTITEVFGLGLIIPIMYAIISPEFLDTNNNWQYIFSHLPTLVISNFLHYILVILFLFFLIKTILVSIISKLQNDFVAKVQSDLSLKLFNNYINLPYNEFVKKNSSTYLKNITNETQYFSVLCIQPLLILLSEFFILFGIGLLLIFFASFETSMTFLLICIPTGIFYFFIKKKIFKLGLERERFDSFKYKFIQESFSGFKSIKLFEKENYFMDKYNPNNIGSAFSESKIRFLISLPRIMLEFFGILLFTVLIFYYSIDDKTPEEFLPILALFMISLVRILPSFNKILSNITSIKSSEPVINTLYEELNLNYGNINKDRRPIIKSFKKKILIKNLDFSHKNNDRFIFKDFNFEIRKNSSVAILGESGSGKSTFLDLILGIIPYSKGKIYFDDLELSKNTIDYKKLIGYVPQNTFLLNETVKENIALGVEEKKINLDRIYEVLKLTNLYEHIMSLENKIETKVGEKGANFSGGQGQRLGIARALYNNPEILVFDEATSALDEKIEKSIFKEIFEKKINKTIIFATHRKSIKDYCDYVYEIKDKKIIKI